MRPCTRVSNTYPDIVLASHDTGHDMLFRCCAYNVKFEGTYIDIVSWRLHIRYRTLAASDQQHKADHLKTAFSFRESVAE